jgi:3-hydroxyisobutyrate dehydrogenase-like beta-hydroxyacid dehydrogenase
MRRAVSDTRPVAVIGLGLMGEVYATRLIAAGVPVIGYDIDQAKRARLGEIGGRAVETVAELAKASRCILIAVFSTDQVEDVIENHLLAALGEGSGKIVLCASTCDPDRIAALAARLIPRGIRFLDTPVSGSSDQVRRGDGVCLIGGDDALAEEVKPVLDALFGRRFHVGRVGDGGRAKLAVNLILGLNRAALAEGLIFAERLGLDPAKFLEVAKGSASQSQVMGTKGPKMVSGDFSPQGYAHQALKDTWIMLAQARARGQRLPMLEVYSGMLQACVEAGEGELDNSVVINEVRRRMARDD